MIGYDFFKVKGYSFKLHLGALIPLSFPHTKLPHLNSELESLLSSHHSLFVRWDCDFDLLESSEWWHVIKDVKEDIADLPKKTRYQVKKGLKSFDIKRVESPLIQNECYQIYHQTFGTYNTIEGPLDNSSFKSRVASLPNESEFWVISDKESGAIVGFAENYVAEGACFYSSIWILPEAQKRFASYALFHVMNSHYLTEIGVKYVSDGARSISHDTNVHQFLQSKFGFRKAYSNLNIVYKPWFGMCVKCLYPFNNIISKLPGKFFQKVAIVLFQESIRRACVSKRESK